MASKPGAVVNEWVHVPQHIGENLGLMVGDEKVQRVYELRHVESDSGIRFYLSKLIYNRVTLAGYEALSWVTFASPRIFFQAGDGSEMSPPGVGPVISVLFPISLVGMALSFKKEKRVFVLFLVVLLLASLSGRKTMAMLFPLMICYIYFAASAIGKIEKRSMRKVIVGGVVAVGLFEIGRMLWLMG